MLGKTPTLLGISFDGLPVSGIVNELLHVAIVFQRKGYRVLLDLGYDIIPDQRIQSTSIALPRWAAPVRILGSHLPSSYSSDRIADAKAMAMRGTRVDQSNLYRDLLAELATGILTTLREENVRWVLVENGTIPDNPLVTEALYLALTEYGTDQQLEKYVLWRDHDLMWSVEPHLYGTFPYPGVRKPTRNPYIEYAVSSTWMQRRIEAWAPGPSYHVLPNRFYSPTSTRPDPQSMRRYYGIPADAYLISRCTRVIPQKTIQRDLYLLARLQERLKAQEGVRDIFLFITGPWEEDPEEFRRLRELEKSLSMEGQVFYGNGLLPLNPLLADEGSAPPFSIRHLLAEAQLSSFLTSFDYEGFGNPPGEAMAMGVPFISTTYELYHEVYGSRGAVAPLLKISRHSSPHDSLPDAFVSWVLRLLTESEYRSQVIRHNLSVCRTHFSLDALEEQLQRILRLESSRGR